MNCFEDRGEVGDAYFSIPPDKDNVIHGPSGAFRAWSQVGKVNSSITVEFELEIPKSTEPVGRSIQTCQVPVRTIAALSRDCREVRFRTELDNCVRDHRLRVLFPTGISSGTSFSDMPFDFPERPIQQPDTPGWFERGYPNHPMRHFCAVRDHGGGLAVMTRGLPEYEVYDDTERTIAVTLLRGSRVKTPKVKSVDTEQQGTQHSESRSLNMQYGLSAAIAVNYSVPRWITAFPLKAAQSGRQKGTLPMEMSFISVSSPFSLCALKKIRVRKFRHSPSVEYLQ